MPSGTLEILAWTREVRQIAQDKKFQQRSGQMPLPQTNRVPSEPEEESRSTEHKAAVTDASIDGMHCTLYTGI